MTNPIDKPKGAIGNLYGVNIVTNDFIPPSAIAMIPQHRPFESPTAFAGRCAMFRLREIASPVDEPKPAKPEKE